MCAKDGCDCLTYRAWAELPDEEKGKGMPRCYLMIWVCDWCGTRYEIEVPLNLMDCNTECQLKN